MSDSTERWCFAKDDDGHNFLIPARLKKKFDADMEKAYSTDDFGCVDWVDEYRTDSHQNYSFTDPKEDLR